MMLSRSRGREGEDRGRREGGREGWGGEEGIRGSSGEGVKERKREEEAEG